MSDTITTQTMPSNGTRAAAQGARQPAPRGSDLVQFQQELQAIGDRHLRREALLRALFAAQLKRPGVEAVAAMVYRNGGMAELGVHRSQWPLETLKTLSAQAMEACDRQGTSEKHPSTQRVNERLHCIVIPVRKGGVAALVVWLKTRKEHDPSPIEVHAAQLMAAQWDRCESLRRASMTSQQLASASAVVDLVQRVESTVNLKQACQVVAAALKDHLPCEQVVIGLNRGKPACRLTTISGLSKFDRQSEECRDLQSALQECQVRGTTSSWPPLGKNVESDSRDRQATAGEPTAQGQLLALKQLARNDKCIVGVPLKLSDGTPIGAVLIVGQREMAGAAHVPRFLEALAEPLATAFALTRRAEGSRLRQVAGGLSSRRSIKRVCKVAAGAIIATALLAMPMPHKIACQSVVEPVERRFCVAPHDGILAATLVEPGITVKQDQLLARMDDREILWELAGIQADLSRAKKQHDAHLAKHETTKAVLAELEVDRLETRSALVKYRQAHLEILSPSNGIVLSGSLEKRENYPVSKGQVLYEIAPLEQLKVELSVPAEQITRVSSGMPAEMHFAGVDQSITGVVERIRPRSEVRDGKNIYVADVVIDNEQLALRPGMKGRAKIVGENRSLGWIMFHRAWEQVRTLWPW